MRYCRYGLGFIPKFMPVEPAGFVDKQVARVLRYTSRSDDPKTHYRKPEKNRVLHGDTSTLRTASSTQLTAQQCTEYNTVRTHFTMMFFSNE